ncbi:MAG: NAD(P)H-hydrate epimerase, partial [Polyangiaceae bacterium]
MRALDAQEVARRGEIALMRDAGAAIAALVPRYTRGRRIAGVAGPGNNGGDVFAALASLPATYERVIYAVSSPRESAARADAVERAKSAGVRIVAIQGAAQTLGLADADLVLDGILGVGSRLPLEPPLDGLAEAINASGAPVLAVDLPSGIDATHGTYDPHCVRATLTVTIGALKLGLLLDPARDCVGDLWLAPIDFPRTYA